MLNFFLHNTDFFFGAHTCCDYDVFMYHGSVFICEGLKNVYVYGKCLLFLKKGFSATSTDSF